MCTKDKNELEDFINFEDSKSIQYLKTFGNFIPDKGRTPVKIINSPAVGQIISYTIYVNCQFKNLYTVSINDQTPVGMEIIQKSVQVYKVSKNGNRENVTKKLQNSGGIFFIFNFMQVMLGSVDSEYIIEYQCKITIEKKEYINTASFQGGLGFINSNAVVEVSNDNKKIMNKVALTDNIIKSKGVNEYVVNKTGDIIKYSLQINNDNNILTGVTIEDTLPEGVVYVPNSAELKVENNGTFTPITTNDILTVNNNKLILNLGNINKSYLLNYSVKVNKVEESYINQAVINYNTNAYNTEAITSYNRNTGNLVCTKSVKPKFLNKDGSQIVVYSLDFQSQGYFDIDNIKIIDEIDQRVNIVSVSVPKSFTYKIINNSITFLNSLGAIAYGENFSITITTDFIKVPCGTTIKNLVTVNNNKSNTVSVKKGYAFQAIKVDGNSLASLEGATFNLEDNNNKIIKTIISNENGVIESSINSPGIYYLQEEEAPKGYILNKSIVKITITASDIGQTLNLGNIENYKGYEVDIKKIDKNNHNKLLNGAEFSIYNISNNSKVFITNITTAEEGKVKIILPEGKYELIEIKAPEGYSTLSKPIIFDIETDKN